VPPSPGYNSGMEDPDRSHRRAVCLIVGLLLAFTVGPVGYEMNWLRERRAFLVLLPVAYESPVPAVRLAKQVLPETPRNGAHSLAMWLLNEPAKTTIVIPCPRETPSLFVAGSFPVEAVEDLDQIKLARRLFPEATILFAFFTDMGTGKPLDPQPLHLWAESPDRAP
jgi:hypothetical protein